MSEQEWYSHKIKGIPKSERISVRHYSTDEQLEYIITYDNIKNYKLYKYDKETNTVINTKHKSVNPLGLEEYME